MKLYLAGPMRGMPNYNFPAFWIAATELRTKGYTVYSPAEHDWERNYVVATYGGEYILQSNPVPYLGPKKAKKCVVRIHPDWVEEDLRVVVLREDVAELACCDALALLPGWSESEYSKVEICVAVLLQLPIFEYLDGDLRPYTITRNEIWREVVGCD